MRFLLSIALLLLGLTTAMAQDNTAGPKVRSSHEIAVLQENALFDRINVLNQQLKNAQPQRDEVILTKLKMAQKQLAALQPERIAMQKAVLDSIKIYYESSGRTEIVAYTYNSIGRLATEINSFVCTTVRNNIL